jgi:hypothetical protein
MENLEDFAERVLTRTGKHLNDLPRRVATVGGVGHIFCARENVYVCAVGYPARIDEDGIEYWDDFEVVILK